jgi:hypothetical protein
LPSPVKVIRLPGAVAESSVFLRHELVTSHPPKDGRSAEREKMGTFIVDPENSYSFDDHSVTVYHTRTELPISLTSYMGGIGMTFAITGKHRLPKEELANVIQDVEPIIPEAELFLYAIQDFLHIESNGIDYYKDMVGYCLEKMTAVIDSPFLHPRSRQWIVNRAFPFFLEKQHKQEKRKAKKRIPKAGFVYVLQADSYYKIGLSTNVEKRVKQLSTLPPFDVALIHKIETEDMHQLESELHERFAEKRANGEWFELSEEDLTWLKTL